MNKWYDWINEALSSVGIVLGADMVATKEFLGIILIILNIIVLLVSTGLKLWKWWIDAKKDGKITKDEIDEAIDIISKSKDKVDDINKKEGE